MTTIESTFSAKEPSLGYLYQVKYALLSLLTSSRDLDGSKVRIENLDDVEIEEIDILNLYQTKLHIKNKGNLTDSSVDFWKSIRVWAESITSGLIRVNETLFNLITTENIPGDSVLNRFKDENTTEEAINDLVDKLSLIALNSTNKTNEKAYKAFLILSLDAKRSLVRNIRIVDNSIDVESIDLRIKKQLIFSTYPSYLDAFLELLYGWWFRKAIELLTSKVDFIGFAELQLKIASISESFQADNLPNHFPEQIDVSDDEVTDLKEKMFLKQLSLIQIQTNSKTVKRAISDFRRAFEQRSKWLRLQLLNPEEEEEYDRRLEDHWQNIFELMCDEAEGASQDELGILGRKFYVEQFAKACPQIKIRDKFKEDYLTRGSYQMLADSKKVGWHPKFNEEL
jgi:hypothetical protein